MLIKGGLVLDFDKGCFTMEDIRRPERTCWMPPEATSPPA